MRLALERHATSKLPDEAIDRVTSFGFRGEALPSIASVSRLILESRVRGADGWRIEIDHGERMRAKGRLRLPPGTRIRVERLFDKVPARRKFLRSPRAEYAACLDCGEAAGDGAQRRRRSRSTMTGAGSSRCSPPKRRRASLSFWRTSWSVMASALTVRATGCG